MSDREIKITDRRMFTAEGELREEFRDVEPAAPGEVPAPPAEPPASPRASPPEATASPPSASAPPPAAEERSPRLEIPTGAAALPGPSFFDLVALLAEPIALYLGDAQLPDGQSVENLEMARLHIDLLDVLRQKSSGNLTAQELGFLEDLLYRSRLRYVQKRG